MSTKTQENRASHKPVSFKLSFLFSLVFLATMASPVHAGGGPIAHDIDFEITDFTATGTRRMPLGDNLQVVDTRIDFNLTAETVGVGNTIIREDGDGDLILELGESTFVESNFVISLDITFTDIDPAFNYAHAFAGPALGTVISFIGIEFAMGDLPFVPSCAVGFGAFGGCGVLMDVDDYDLTVVNAPLALGFDVTGDMVDDEIATAVLPPVVPGIPETGFPGLEIDFGNNPDTTVLGNEVLQDYIVELDWLVSINPEVEIALTGLASIKTSANPATVVPLPAAVWFFGAGLLGLFSRAPRRTTRSS